MQTVEIQQHPTEPGWLEYRVRAGGKFMGAAHVAEHDTALLGAILERAVEGIFREGRPWMIRS